VTTHTVALFVHSYLRWLILAAALGLVIKSYLGRRPGAIWSAGNERLHRVFLAALDLQLAIGLLLYAHLSPITRAFFAAPGASMKISELRFFGIEHITMMLVAVTLAHIGRARSKRIVDPAARHARVFGWTLAALVVIFASIPWPFLHAKRPLFRTEGLAVTPVASPSSAACPPAYASRCASCHGPAGLGDGPLAAGLSPRPRSFAEPKWVTDGTQQAVRDVIRDGGAAHGMSPLMPPHPDLDDETVDALAECVRGLGGRAP